MLLLRCALGATLHIRHTETMLRADRLASEKGFFQVAPQKGLYCSKAADKIFHSLETLKSRWLNNDREKLNIIFMYQDIDGGSIDDTGCMWGEGEGQVNDRIVQPRGGGKEHIDLEEQNRKLEAVGWKWRLDTRVRRWPLHLLFLLWTRNLCASVSSPVKETLALLASLGCCTFLMI